MMARAAAMVMIFAFAPAAHADARPALTIIFPQSEAALSQEAERALDALIAKRSMKAQAARPRFIITAFAALPDQPAWAAHRLALARALAVRDYLLRKAVRPKAIILKPIGNLCAVPCQRVDIFLSAR